MKGEQFAVQAEAQPLRHEPVGICEVLNTEHTADAKQVIPVSQAATGPPSQIPRLTQRDGFAVLLVGAHPRPGTAALLRVCREKEGLVMLQEHPDPHPRWRGDINTSLGRCRG